MLPLSRPSCLSVLSVRGVLWSDWGLPRSIEAVLKKIGHLAPRYEKNEAAESALHRLFNDGPEPQKETRRPRKEAVGGGKPPIRREEFQPVPSRPALTP